MFENLSKFMRDRREEQTTKKLSAEQRYYQLILRAGSEGDLPRDASGELYVLAGELNVSHEQVEMHLQASAERQRLQSQASKLDANQEELAAAHHKLQEYEVETSRLVEDLRSKRQVVADQQRQKISDLTRGVAAGEAACMKLKSVENAHWRLFGQPNPAVEESKRKATAEAASRTFYLLQDCSDDNALRRSVMNNVASFEAMISVPGTYGEILKLNFIPIHGQDPERFKQLVALVRNPPRKRGRQAVYLVTREKLHGGGSSAIEFMHYIEDIEANPISLDQCIVMPWPNQSDREREKLIERWQKAYAKAHPGQPANAG